MPPVDPRDPDVFVLKLPNKLDFAHVGSVLTQLEPLHRAGEEASGLRLLIDMTSTVFLSPTGITMLAATVENLWAQGKFTSGALRGPSNPLVARYLQRMDFFKELNLDVPEEFARKPPFGFRPVTSVRDETDSPAVTRDIVGAVADRHELDGATSAALKNSINELVENVFYHAESPIGALVASQAYARKQKTELVIADTGRGIRAALMDEPRYRDELPNDCAAIRLAIKKNVTTTGDDRRGIGLWLTTEMVRRNEGEMLILTNEGGVQITGSETMTNVETYFWPGTLITIEFRMDRPLDSKAVYDSGDFPDADSFDF